MKYGANEPNSASSAYGLLVDPAVGNSQEGVIERGDGHQGNLPGEKLLEHFFQATATAG